MHVDIATSLKIASPGFPASGSQFLVPCMVRASLRRLMLGRKAQAHILDQSRCFTIKLGLKVGYWSPTEGPTLTFTTMRRGLQPTSLSIAAPRFGFQRGQSQVCPYAPRLSSSKPSTTSLIRVIKNRTVHWVEVCSLNQEISCMHFFYPGVCAGFMKI
jgi:hypothetical protein